MTHFKAKDGVGRIWCVDRNFVKEDYVKAIMDMDGVTRKESEKYVDEMLERNRDDLDSWWYEQILPYGDLVKHYGVLIQDITQEEKEDIFDRITNGGMENV